MDWTSSNTSTSDPPSELWVMVMWEGSVCRPIFNVFSSLRVLPVMLGQGDGYGCGWVDCSRYPLPGARGAKEMENVPSWDLVGDFCQFPWESYTLAMNWVERRHFLVLEASIWNSLYFGNFLLSESWRGAEVGKGSAHFLSPCGS